MSTHLKRIVTALVLLVVLCGAVFTGGPLMFSVTLVFALAALWEFYGLFWPGRQGIGKKLIGLVLAVGFFAAAALENPTLIIFSLLLSFWVGNFFFLFCYSKRPDETYYTNVAVLLGGLLYVPLILQFFLFMTPAEIFFVFLASTASDTGAYYTGSYIGRHKIWPQISPKKTWEGSLGGMATCVVACTLYGLGLGNAPVGYWVVLAIFLNLASQFGDFFESALKRFLNVKDSGTILPGHGGILDRIDSLLLVVPVYVAARYLYSFFG